jgi:hypothetical protein
VQALTRKLKNNKIQKILSPTKTVAIAAKVSFSN